MSNTDGPSCMLTLTICHEIVYDVNTLASKPAQPKWPPHQIYHYFSTAERNAQTGEIWFRWCEGHQSPKHIEGFYKSIRLPCSCSWVLISYCPMPHGFFLFFYYKAWFADNGLCNAFFTHELIFKLILFSYNPIIFIWYRTLKVIIGPIDMCVGSNVADVLRWLWLSMDSWDFILKKQNQVTGTPVTSLMADKC